MTKDKITGLKEALKEIERHCPDEDCLKYPKADADWVKLKHILPVKKAAQAHLELLLLLEEFMHRWNTGMAVGASIEKIQKIVNGGGE